jgi:hypothetical protein
MGSCKPCTSSGDHAPAARITVFALQVSVSVSVSVERPVTLPPLRSSETTRVFSKSWPPALTNALASALETRRAST